MVSSTSGGSVALVATDLAGVVLVVLGLEAMSVSAEIMRGMGG